MYKKILRQIQKSENISNISKPSFSNIIKINPEHGRTIAQAYDQMQHDPDHPEVKQAYAALIDETKNQFNDLMKKGLKISRIEPGMKNPYNNSRELHDDIKNNNHLWYFPTDLGYGDDSSPLNHPMLQSTGIKHGDKELLANDLFRIVHDINGHHLGGESGFGPAGEHKAYLTHKKMYSPIAARALASETLGQNSWVNFGPYAEHNAKNPHKTIYADQKAGLLPDEIINQDWHIEKIQKSEFDFEMEWLEKAADKDQLINLKDENQKKDLLEWSKKHIPNLGMRVWYLSHIGKNPELHEKHQKDMEHHGAMHKINNEINNIKFNKNLSLEDGLKHLSDADSKWKNEALSKKRLVDPNDYENLREHLKLNDGWSWYDLGKDSCSLEGKAMGHCGTGREGNRLFSLRKKVMRGNKEFHEPYLTFETNPDGVIVQAKGRGNEKPDKKYHGAIVPFLNSEGITGIIPSEYKPESDFQFSDLSDTDKEKVNQQKPTFDFFNSPYDPNHPAAKINSPSVESHKALWEKYNGDLDKFSEEQPLTSAKYPNHTTESLEKLSNHPKADSYVLSTIARHSNHTPESLEKLSNHPKADSYVLRTIANHPNHTLESLEKLSNHRKANDDVLSTIARYSNHTPESLEKLSNHPEANYRLLDTIARHSNHTPESLEKLSNHPKADDDVLQTIQSHPNYKNIKKSQKYYSEKELNQILKQFAVKKSIESTKKYSNLSKNEIKTTFSKVIKNSLKNEQLNKNSDISMDEEASPLMNRQEDKFFLPASKFQKFITLISEKLKEGDIDTSVRYNTNKTIYLDSKDLDSFRDNLEGIKPRFKVRIRQYKPNDQEWESTAYIELKIKTEEGITKKTRIRIYSFMIPDIEEGKEIKADGLEIINKDISKIELWKRLVAINTIIQKYGFKKQVVVEYNRRAYSGKDIRITIDDSLRYHEFRSLDENTKKAILKSKGWKKIENPADKIKNNDYFILEVKHPGKLPKWLKEAISDTKVKPVRFSKYCSAIATYLKTDNLSAPIQRQKINFNPVHVINAVSIVLKSEKITYSKQEAKQLLKKHIIDKILKSLEIHNNIK